jgi:hydroxymethylpyrimidine kinase/phosphomethylpyrimidine kinase/thiamine-phosphate diphosphorylase
MIKMVNVKRKPAVLSISAHDPLGMAGIAMDQRALQSMGVHCAGCITANTAQNQTGFFSLNPVDNHVFVRQLDALYKQDIFSVIKIGLISDIYQVKALVAHPIFSNKTIVLDPVLGASSDNGQVDQGRLEALIFLMKYVNVLTPNVDEARTLMSVLDAAFTQFNDVLELAKTLHQHISCVVLLKGGHGAHKAKDLYCDNERHFYLEHAEFTHGFNRGTGCAMASVISGAIALGHSIADAVVIAKMQMDAGWQHPFSIDEHTGSLGFVTFNQSDASQFKNSQLPSVYVSEQQKDLNFLPCGHELGLYPIVDRAQWLERLLPLGVKVIQLRVKDLTGDALKAEIMQCVKMANQYDCQLYINDYWQLAIECGAYGVHLGQEDIDDADLSAIAKAGLRLGLSSHCFYEVARAKTIKPSYIAFGPVYATQTKDMPWVPQGETGLSYWRAQLADFPLVAIGGIHGERFEKVKAQGVDSIAMISAITQAENPEQVCVDFIDRWNS